MDKQRALVLHGVSEKLLSAALETEQVWRETNAHGEYVFFSALGDAKDAIEKAHELVVKAILAGKEEA